MKYSGIRIRPILNCRSEKMQNQNVQAKILSIILLILQIKFLIYSNILSKHFGNLMDPNTRLIYKLQARDYLNFIEIKSNLRLMQMNFN